ncbi:hypothetical protein RIR_jg40148.t1 [Rhizophagus irregularis DAOM 181602=DAOM 197198]|nr:hypothetical protein RIR_jg40148.t1 [Rhizophagus irregularis DAOM 181602=DAOM 197198]
MNHIQTKPAMDDLRNEVRFLSFFGLSFFRSQGPLVLPVLQLRYFSSFGSTINKASFFLIIAFIIAYSNNKMFQNKPRHITSSGSSYISAF